jgi:MerR family copper efflux transcriptional regulator
MNSETGLGGDGSTRPFTVSHSATVIVRQRQRMAHGDLKASIADRGLAARLIAAHANVDASAARGASLGTGFDITHDDGPWAMTSFCRRRPTSLPSDDYEPPIIDRLTFIRQAQSAGFTLGQIRGVLDIGDRGEPSCEHVAQLIDARLRDVQTRIAVLKATRTHLRALAERAAAQDPSACTGYCSILTRLV